MSRAVTAVPATRPRDFLRVSARRSDRDPSARVPTNRRGEVGVIGDQSASTSTFDEAASGVDLWTHASSGELTVGQVPSSFLHTHHRDRGLFWRSIVEFHSVDTCEDEELRCVDVERDDGGGEILVHHRFDPKTGAPTTAAEAAHIRMHLDRLSEASSTRA